MEGFSQNRLEDVVINSTLRSFQPAIVFEFERDFKAEEAIFWFRNNRQFSVLVSAVYVVLVFAGRWFMSSRTPYDLRIPLAVWSAGLAVFSWAGMLRLSAETYHVFRTYGWHASVCDPGVYQGTTGYWVWIFTLSKLPELGDTAFIVLRKQNLIFLHWYHHITVLMYSWYSYSQIVSLARYFAVMNYTVHSFMYSYYAIRASRLMRIPSWIGMLITSLQITQMLVGCVVNGYAYSQMKSGGTCATNDENMRMSFLMYFSYLLLFVHFFYERYMSKPRPVREKRD
ncbi:elongation of very long chain fatty acids protein 6-like [Patiria miniata]|uniref:Elongation of very long chain fatty acids protein n=1 Tax=Patiria miniata TaxID=46514 RepID=A0A914ACH9_PATMI|nr:elongation of very long chain fatty acids protein 6-like [Patiria miniata]